MTNGALHRITRQPSRCVAIGCLSALALGSWRFARTPDLIPSVVRKATRVSEPQSESAGERRAAIGRQLARLDEHRPAHTSQSQARADVPVPLPRWHTAHTVHAQAADRIRAERQRRVLGVERDATHGHNCVGGQGDRTGVRVPVYPGQLPAKLHWPATRRDGGEKRRVQATALRFVASAKWMPRQSSFFTAVARSHSFDIEPEGRCRSRSATIDAGIPASVRSGSTRIPSASNPATMGRSARTVRLGRAEAIIPEEERVQLLALRSALELESQLREQANGAIVGRVSAREDLSETASR